MNRRKVLFSSYNAPEIWGIVLLQYRWMLIKLLSTMHNVKGDEYGINRGFSLVTNPKFSVGYTKKLPKEEHPVRLTISRFYEGSDGTTKFQSVVDREFETKREAQQFAYEHGYLRRYFSADDPLDPEDSSDVVLH